MSTAPRTWPILLLLGLASVPLVLMYIYLVIDTVTDAPSAISSFAHTVSKLIRLRYKYRKYILFSLNMTY